MNPDMVMAAIAAQRETLQTRRDESVAYHEACARAAGNRALLVLPAERAVYVDRLNEACMCLRGGHAALLDAVNYSVQPKPAECRALLEALRENGAAGSDRLRFLESHHRDWYLGEGATLRPQPRPPPPMPDAAAALSADQLANIKKVKAAAAELTKALGGIKEFSTADKALLDSATAGVKQAVKTAVTAIERGGKNGEKSA